MTTHTRLSPSSRVRWANCAASVNEGRKYPNQPSGPAAIDGTHTHTLLEKCIKVGAASAVPSIGVRYKDQDGEFVVDADRAARVDVALRYVNERVAEVLVTEGVPAVVLSESRVEPEHFIGRNDCGDTVDIQIISQRVLEIIDYKDGMMPVDVRDNMQLEMYALGALAKYKLPINAPYPVDTVRMTLPKIITAA